MIASKGSFQILDHTADVGIQVEAETLEDLFRCAAEAMFSVIVDSKSNLIPALSIPIEINCKDFEIKDKGVFERLLVKWLQELLYIFETRHLIPTHYYIDNMSESIIEGCVKGQRFDRNRHKLKSLIKAVTYHKLKVEKNDTCWFAQVIFDI